MVQGVMVLGGDRPAWGQVFPHLISPDFSTSTTLTSLGGNQWEITGSSQAGSHLFHSFLFFNVSPGHTVTFKTDPGVTDIFTRVTGGFETDILGTLRVDGHVNLFLLNPAGITLGPNARLDVAGALSFTTAKELRFPGATFRADFLPPLLNLSNLDRSPEGLVFDNPGRIQVDGTGPSLANQLTVGNGLALLGGQVELSNRRLGLAQGGIVLAALDDNSSMGISYANQRPSFTPDGNAQFKSLTLEQAEIQASGAASGSDANLSLFGRDINLEDSSIYLGPFVNDGSVLINASHNLELEDSSVILDATQNSGLLALTAGQSLQLRGASPLLNRTGLPGGYNRGIQLNGSGIELNNSGAGLITLTGDRGGDISLNASQDIKLLNRNLLNALANVAGADAGQISLTGQRIELRGDSSIVTLSDRLGGNVSLTASDQVTLDDSVIFTGPLSPTGRTGDVRITTDDLNLKRSAIVVPSWLDGGQIALSGKTLDLRQSVIETQGLLHTGSTQAGPITATFSERITLGDQSRIRSLSQQRAGALTLQAEKEIRLSDQSTIAVESVLGGANLTLSTGVLGAGAIGSGSTGEIRLRDGSAVLLSVSTDVSDGPGSLGRLEVRTARLTSDKLLGNNDVGVIGPRTEIDLQVPRIDGFFLHAAQIDRTNARSEIAGNTSPASSQGIRPGIDSPPAGLPIDELLSNRLINLRARAGENATPPVTTEVSSSSSSSSSEAQSVEIMVPLLGDDRSGASWASPSFCAARNSNGPGTQNSTTQIAGGPILSYSGRGGLPPSPSSWGMEDSLWLSGDEAIGYAKLQKMAPTSTPAPAPTPASSSASPVAIAPQPTTARLVEATGWRLNPSGQVVLVAEPRSHRISQGLACTTLSTLAPIFRSAFGYPLKAGPI